jgi:hypothetical protein
MFSKLSAIALLLSLAVQASEPGMAAITIDRAFTPVGLDSSESAQVVIAGSFPDTCYQATSPLVPYQTVVTFGVLEPGTYRLLDGVTGRTIGTLPIKPTVYLDKDLPPYAPLTEAVIVNEAGTGSPTLVLRGEWLDRCTDFKRVEVIYSSQSIVVRPIITSPETKATYCGVPSRSGFEKRVALRPMPGTFLLHVRTAGGKALNQVYGQAR